MKNYTKNIGKALKLLINAMFTDWNLNMEKVLSLPFKTALFAVGCTKTKAQVDLLLALLHLLGRETIT